MAPVIRVKRCWAGACATLQEPRLKDQHTQNPGLVITLTLSCEETSVSAFPRVQIEKTVKSGDNIKFERNAVFKILRLYPQFPQSCPAPAVQDHETTRGHLILPRDRAIKDKVYEMIINHG